MRIRERQLYLQMQYGYHKFSLRSPGEPIVFKHFRRGLIGEGAE